MLAPNRSASVGMDDGSSAAVNVSDGDANDGASAATSVRMEKASMMLQARILCKPVIARGLSATTHRRVVKRAAELQLNVPYAGTDIRYPVHLNCRRTMDIHLRHCLDFNHLMAP